jgi:hypothetical protein
MYNILSIGRAAAFVMPQTKMPLTIMVGLVVSEILFPLMLLTLWLLGFE